MKERIKLVECARSPGLQYWGPGNTIYKECSQDQLQFLKGWHERAAAAKFAADAARARAWRVLRHQRIVPTTK